VPATLKQVQKRQRTNYNKTFLMQLVCLHLLGPTPRPTHFQGGTTYKTLS